jgi:hypothetical protein
VQGNSVAGEVSYQLAEADYISANRDWFGRALLRWRTLITASVMMVVIFVIGFAMARFLDGASLIGQFGLGLSMAGMGLVVLLFLYSLSFLLLPRRAERLFRQQTSMHKLLRFAWSGKGCVQGSAHGEGTYVWSDLHRWSNGSSAVLIYHTDNLFFVLPRRALTDEQHRDLVDTLSASGLPRY